MYLSTIKDDLEGAAHLFEMGLKHYPEDYYLNYYSGFNYFYEMGQFKKGYEKLKKIEKHPRLNRHLRTVIAKLNFEITKDYDIAIELLKENIRITNDEMIKKKLEGDLYSVTAMRDLECLNGGKKGCYLVDYEGKSYLKGADGKWRAQKKFKPYKIFRPDFIESSHPVSL